MRNKGIALIMAVGVLALLAVIATSFALNMRLEYHAAVNYYNGVKARYFAESALERAIAELRTHVKSSAFDDLTSPTETWGTTGYDNAAYLTNSKTAGYINSSGTSKTTIIRDEQRKININMVDSNNTSQELLNNLATILKDKVSGYNILATNDGGAIMQNRPTTGYVTVREIVGMANPNRFNKDKFELLKDCMTATSYVDPNCENRAPININTADETVIAAVLMGLASTKPGPVPVGNNVTAIDVDTAWDIAERIREYRTGTGPIDSWGKFDDIIDDAVSDGDLMADEGMVIKYNCNPNRPKPSKYTTEFCFNSGGYYEVIARGTVTDSLTGLITYADRTISAIVNIYDIYCETKVKDASDNPTQFALGTPERVTWLDSCPVRSDQVFGVYEIPGDAEVVPGSIKLGFWDDFHSTAQGGDRVYSNKHWGGAWGGDPEVFNDQDGDGYDELITLAGVRTDLYGTNGFSEWTWGDFALRVSANEYDTSGAAQMKDAAWILFRKDSSSITTPPDNQNFPAVIHTRNDVVLSWNGSAYGYLVPDNPDGKVEFLTPAEAVGKGYYGFTDEAAAIARRYKYPPGQIRIFTLYQNDKLENYESSEYKEDLPSTTNKTFNIRTLADGADPKAIEVVVLPSSGGSGTFNRTLDQTVSHSGRVVLYANNVNVAWKDIRIIPAPPTILYPYPSTFTSQVIDSSKIHGLSSTGVEWGTITATLTLPQEPTWDAGDQFKWKFWTKIVGASGPPDLAYPPENAIMGTSLFVVNCNTGTANTNLQWSNLTFDDSPTYSGDRKGSIQYKVELQTTNMKKTPVLEDITITYLPKVAIKSYSLAQ